MCKNKVDPKEFIREAKHNPVLSNMALIYLMDKGAELVKQLTEEEYGKAIDAAIKDAEDKGGFYPLSKDFAMDILRMAKKMADIPAMDLVAVMGNECYQQPYANIVGGDANAKRMVLECPHCRQSGNHFFMDGEADNEIICAKCGREYRLPMGATTNDGIVCNILKEIPQCSGNIKVKAVRKGKEMTVMFCDLQEGDVVTTNQGKTVTVDEAAHKIIDAPDAAYVFFDLFGNAYRASDFR